MAPMLFMAADKSKLPPYCEMCLYVHTTVNALQEHQIGMVCLDRLANYAIDLLAYMKHAHAAATAVVAPARR